MGRKWQESQFSSSFFLRSGHKRSCCAHSGRRDRRLSMIHSSIPFFCVHLAVTATEGAQGGVRPTSGAATSVHGGRPEYSRVSGESKIAAPEDGRTPSALWQAQPQIRIAEPRATPRPFLREYHKFCLRRVVLDVSSRPRLMLVVAHVCIPVTFLPERPLAPQNLIRRLGRVSLPVIHQPPHRHVLNEKEQMDVIRH